MHARLPYESLRVRTVLGFAEEEVVYPSARRLGGAPGCAAENASKSRWRRSGPNRCEAEVGHEILDIFLCKNSKYVDGGLQSSSPPCDSPPSRSGNPIVKDLRFNHERNTRLGPNMTGNHLSHTKFSSQVQVHCTAVRSVPNVRVEGFFSPSTVKTNNESRCIPLQCA